MELRDPKSTEECVYFTRRAEGDGKVIAWTLKEKCPKCKEGLMGKPKEKGKVKIRSQEYVCPECNYKIDKDEYEPTLTVSIRYTCQHCKHEGETQIPFKRKKIQRLNEKTGKKKAIDTLRFYCDSCKKPIDVTKKMK